MKNLFSIAVFAVTIANLHAASVIVNWSIATDPVRRLVDSTGVPLSAGTSLPGDGTLVQLGYYDLATMANPFSGAWVILATTSMGDNGVEVAGKFSTSSLLSDGSFLAPAVGTPLAIRFYDGTSVSSSSFYNAVSVSDGTWNFINPSDPAAVLNLVIDKGASTVFEGGIFSDFKTTRPIPEPSSLCLMALATASFLLVRSRSRTV